MANSYIITIKDLFTHIHSINKYTVVIHRGKILNFQNVNIHIKKNYLIINGIFIKNNNGGQYSLNNINNNKIYTSMIKYNVYQCAIDTLIINNNSKRNSLNRIHKKNESISEYNTKICKLNNIETLISNKNININDFIQDKFVVQCYYNFIHMNHNTNVIFFDIVKKVKFVFCRKTLKLTFYLDFNYKDGFLIYYQNNMIHGVYFYIHPDVFFINNLINAHAKNQINM
jgi:hypothetical protein